MEDFAPEGRDGACVEDQSGGIAVTAGRWAFDEDVDGNLVPTGEAGIRDEHIPALIRWLQEREAAREVRSV